MNTSIRSRLKADTAMKAAGAATAWRIGLPALAMALCLPATAQASCTTNPLTGTGCDAIIIGTPGDANASPAVIAPDAAGNFVIKRGASIVSNVYGVVLIDTPLQDFVNYGNISSDPDSYNASVYNIDTTIGRIINAGSITGAWVGIELDEGSIGSILNSGVISSDSRGYGILNYSTTNGIGEIVNTGRLTGVYPIFNQGIIGTITNTGSIVVETDLPNYAGIWTDYVGTIGTLNNAQGAGNPDGPLTYRGLLPGAYNMIARGGSYGQLAVNYEHHTGTMTFGIFGGDPQNGIKASRLQTGTYVDVMTGVNVDNIDNEWVQTTEGDHRSFGNYNGVLWMLRENQEDYSWNVEVQDILSASGAAVDRQMSDLQGMIDTGAGSAYGCQLEPGKRGCLAIKGGAAAQGHDASNGAVTLLGGLRIGRQLSAGGFLQQGLSHRSPYGVDYSASMPSLGGFLAYSQHEDLTGYQAKASLAVARGKAVITRDNLLGSALTTSGTADVDGYALAQTVGYGIGIDNTSVMTPYLGLAYVRSGRGGYSESSDVDGIDDAFDYAAFDRHATIAALGIAYARDTHAGLRLRAGAGLTYVLNAGADDLLATSNLPGAETLRGAPQDQTGGLGLAVSFGTDYAIAENQSVGLDASAWRSVSTGDYGYALMLGWTLGLGEDREAFSK